MKIFKEDSDSNIFTYNFKTYNLVSTLTYAYFSEVFFTI